MPASKTNRNADRDAEPSGSASDQAYNAIVDMILCRDLRPGERTSVNLLAGRLMLGRTPIKEAITRLQAEGVLSVAGRSGTTVNSIGARETAQIFALRRTLEGFATEAAVQNVSVAQLAKLRELLVEMSVNSDEHAKGRDVVRATARFVKANVVFHKTLVSAAANPFLDRLYAQLQLQVQIVTYLINRGFDPKAAERRQREHEEIVAALEARDAGLLRDRLLAHAEGTEAVILRALGVSDSGESAGKQKRGPRPAKSIRAGMTR
ncbi:MAG: GntR family transcriptional regulator [bacterium]|nr:GntR family transcriptional regulator [bacterium]